MSFLHSVLRRCKLKRRSSLFLKRSSLVIHGCLRMRTSWNRSCRYPHSDRTPLLDQPCKRAGSLSVMKYLRPIRSKDGPSRAEKSGEPSSLVEAGTRLVFDRSGGRGQVKWEWSGKVGVVFFRAHVLDPPTRSWL